MKITAQEEYGLRCVLQLARPEAAKGLTVREIALREGLSAAYVEKLLRLMSKSGLIHSVRGVKGGYLLSRRAGQITLAEVVQALGSVPSPTEICQRYPGNRNSCVHIDDCCIRSAWTTLTEAIQRFLHKTPLSDLVGKEEAVQTTLMKRMIQPHVRIDFGETQ